MANLAVNCIRCNSSKAANMTPWDLADTTANLVVDRVSARRGNGKSVQSNRTGSRRANSSRKATCPICGRGRNPDYPYCRNCNDKARGRPIAKNPGECKFGRCHKPVATTLFGILSHDYCALHQKQHERGLI